MMWSGSVASRNAVRSAVDMARAPVGIELLDAAAAAVRLCRRCDAVAVLAEDDALPRRIHLPQSGEMGVLPAISVQLPHRRLVLVAREEGLGVAHRSPKRDERVVRAVGEVVPTDEAGRSPQLLHQPGGGLPEAGRLSFVDEGGLQYEHGGGPL